MSRYRCLTPFTVMASLVPAIHAHARKAWMAVTSTALTAQGWM